jgi:hypothetical protein
MTTMSVASGVKKKMDESTNERARSPPEERKREKNDVIRPNRKDLLLAVHSEMHSRPGRIEGKPYLRLLEPHGADPRQGAVTRRQPAEREPLDAAFGARR